MQQPDPKGRGLLLLLIGRDRDVRRVARDGQHGALPIMYGPDRQRHELGEKDPTPARNLTFAFSFGCNYAALGLRVKSALAE